MSESKKKIIVVVPRRAIDPQGFWSLGISRGQGVYFPQGKTEIEVSDAELAELQTDEGKGFLTIVELSAGERLLPQDKPVEKPAAQPQPAQHTGFKK